MGAFSRSRSAGSHPGLLGGVPKSNPGRILRSNPGRILLGSNPGRILGVIWVGFWLLLSGCSREQAPSLLEIEAAGPSVVENATLLEIHGAGFPAGRIGTVALRGHAYAAARSPEHVEVELEARAESSAYLRVPLQREHLRALTGGAHHATFRGKAEVEFSPLRPGAPALRGESGELVLDAFFRASDTEATLMQSRAFSEFLGLEISEQLVVSQVMPDSLAARVGLRVGDRLHDLDGVRLHSRKDWVPRTRQHLSFLEISRPGHSGRATVQIPRSGFQTIDSRLAHSALAGLLGLIVVIALVARPPRTTVWLASRRAKGPSWRPWPRAGGNGLVVASMVGALSVLGFLALLEGGIDTTWAGVELDLPLVLALSLLPVIVSSFMLAGGRQSGGFSLLGALFGVAGAVAATVPVLMATALASSRVGSLQLADFVRQQTPAPSGWFVFSHPLALLMGVAFWISLVPLAGRRPPVDEETTARSGRRRAASRLPSRVLEWFGQSTLLGLWVILFLGGSAVPPAWAALGPAVLFVKWCAVAAGLVWIRSRTGHIRRTESWRPFLLATVIASTCAPALVWLLGRTAWGSSLPSEFDASWLGVMSLSGGVALALLGFVAFHRALVHRGRVTDPWI